MAFLSWSYLRDWRIYRQSLCKEQRLPESLHSRPECLGRRQNHQRMQDSERGQQCRVPERRRV